jgi:hypothetical protein
MSVVRIIIIDTYHHGFTKGGFSRTIFPNKHLDTLSHSKSFVCMIFEMIERYLHGSEKLYLERHDDMSEFFFLCIMIGTMQENRGETRLKSNTDFFLRNYL